MSSGKWFSLTVGLTGLLLVCACMSYAHLAGAPIAGGLVTVVVLGLITGLGMASAHAFVVTRFADELDRLVRHVDGLSRQSHTAPPPFVSRMGLAPVAEACDRAVAQLRKRLEQLVTQRRELEVQLRISDAERQHAEAILNSIADAVIVTDAFNEVALANEAAARALGFDLQQVLRKPVDQAVRDSTIVKLVKDMREGGDPALRRHVEHAIGRNGHNRVYDVTLSCLTNSGESEHAAPEAAGVVTILRDITREKEIAEMKTEFVSNVSHELRTPLSSIKAYMEMLVDGEAQDEQTRAEFYNIIQGETNRLQRLIDNILNISRIESGVVKVQREHIALPQLIKEVIDVMQPQARAKQIELEEAPTPLFFQVFADKDMVYQATLNLVGNAIKYTNPGGKVSVAVSVDEHSKMVNVSVRDSGVGIPPADLPHLFEKFYRVADHKKMAKGTGLGLNLVKQIIEVVHGGKVSVKSEVGRGSTFTFSLPLADSGY